MDKYYITDCPHYKGGTRHELYSSNNLTDIRKAARRFALKKYMIDIWESGKYASIGCAIMVGHNTVYHYDLVKKNGMYRDVFKKILPSGKLSDDITPSGVHQGLLVLNHWL